MRRVPLAAGAAFAALLLAASASAVQAQPKPLGERLRDACRAVREVDRARLPEPRDLSGLDYHAETRGGAGTPPAGHAGPLIRLFLQQSVPGPFPSLSVIAWKRPDGRWFISRMSNDPPGGMPGMPLMWPHEPGVDTAGLPASYWSMREGMLGEAESAELEQILASRCLTREPPVRPANLPIRGGADRLCMWHPTSYHLEISGGRGGSARGYTRSCRLYRKDNGTEEVHWASDLLADLLGRAPVGAVPAVGRREAGAIPERFRGRWAQGVESCDDTGFTRVQVGADSIDLGAGQNRVRSVELRGERTLVVNASGPSFFPGMPSEDFEVPLLLSPGGDRLTVPQSHSGWILHLNRCPAA